MNTEFNSRKWMERLRDDIPTDLPEIDNSRSVDLSGIFSEEPKSKPSFTYEDAVALVLKQIGSDDASARALLHRIGWDRIAQFRPQPLPVPLPADDFDAIELSIGDNGESAVKRKDRQSLRYIVTIQTFGRAGKLRRPSWKGYARLRDVDRTKVDLKRLNSAKQRHGFSDEYCDWLENVVIAQAVAHDALIGFIYSKPKGEGTVYHDKQVLLVQSSVLDPACAGWAMLISGDAISIIDTFSANDSHNNPLAGSFVRQARGSIGNHFVGWPTCQVKTNRSKNS